MAVQTERMSGTVRRNETALVGFTVATNLADGVTKIVLPLLAVGLTDSPGLVAGVGLTLTLPWLLASLHVGVFVDRNDRRRLAAAANLIRLVVTLSLLAAVAGDALSLPMIYAAGAVIGLAEVVADSAVGALVPAAVPRERLGRVNAWIAGAETVANEFAGPAIGGLLVGFGAALALGSSAAAFALGAVLLALLAGRFRVSAEERDSGPAREPGRGRAELVEGLAFLWRHRLLRTMSLTISALVACWSAWLALLPSYALRLLDLDPAGYGLLLSAIGLGGLLGAVLVTTVNRLLGVRWALFVDLVGTVVMMIVPAVFPDAWAVGAAAFVGGMGGTLWTVNSRTLAQMIVPDRLLGRYGSAARLLSWGMLPIGAGLAGLLAEIVGLTGAFAIFAVVAALPIVPFLMTVTTRDIEVAQRRSELDHEILG
ncbi:MFS transporter [Streptosporangium canum]|uniref:MFS transporter n=1 Tax=Streptosporangium canum TaxID=324952 RepID=UPI00379144F9